MRMPKGKHVTINRQRPEAVAICDVSGFVHLHKDLIPEMAWRGNRLVATGFLVGPDYLSQPNPNLCPPILPPDPVPVNKPRFPQTWETPTPMLPPVPIDEALRRLNEYHWSSGG